MSCPQTTSWVSPSAITVVGRTLSRPRSLEDRAPSPGSRVLGPDATIGRCRVPDPLEVVLPHAEYHMWNCVPSWITAAPSRRAESTPPRPPPRYTGWTGPWSTPRRRGGVALSVGVPAWSSGEPQVVDRPVEVCSSGPRSAFVPRSRSPARSPDCRGAGPIRVGPSRSRRTQHDHQHHGYSLHAHDPPLCGVERGPMRSCRASQRDRPAQAHPAILASSLVVDLIRCSQYRSQNQDCHEENARKMCGCDRASRYGAAHPGL